MEAKRILDEISGFLNDLSLLGQAADFFFVAGEGQPFVEGSVDLAAQLAHSPLVGGGFDLVEMTFGRVIEGEQFYIVRPAEGKAAEQGIEIAKVRFGSNFGRVGRTESSGTNRSDSV